LEPLEFWKCRKISFYCITDPKYSKNVSTVKLTHFCWVSFGWAILAGRFAGPFLAAAQLWAFPQH